MKPRVLILTSERTDAPGGMEHVLRELEKGLARTGYSVQVLHRENAAPLWVAKPGNKWAGFAADVALSWFLGRKVRSLLDSDLAAVISNGPIGWYLPNLPDSVKKVHFYHGTYRRQAERIRPFISLLGSFKLKWWDSMLLERWSGLGKAIVCNSDQTREEVEEFFGYTGETVWLPLDTAHFTHSDMVNSRRKVGLPESGPVGIFVGSSHPTKGFFTVRALIEAFPEVHWCLALRGPIPSEVSSSPRISIFPNATPQILPFLYSAADFAVCPSLYESFGYVVVEALACGVPVVASFGGASTAFLQGTDLEHLLVADSESIVDFGNAIRAILAAPGRHREIVTHSIRPEIQKRMEPENWVRRFCALAGL